MNQRKSIMSSYIGVAVMAGIIFLAGGRLRYWQALLYLALALLGTTITHLLAPPASDLAARRVANARAGEAWDRRLMGFYFLLTLRHLWLPDSTLAASGGQARCRWA